MQNVEVSLGTRSYGIMIGPGLLPEAGRLIAGLLAPRRTLLVTDSNVAPLYLETVAGSLEAAGFAVARAIVPAGESSKSHEQLLRLYEACFKAGLERRSLIVALGGGVIGDLAGYAAGTYLRGLPFVQLPTTLLAQVDSSIGGKTGINLPGGKNLVGAFHQPALVLADVSVLATLDQRQFATGLAEIVKHAMIADRPLFERLEREADQVLAREPKLLEEIVAWNCRIKAAVVAADEHESGLRAILNYGHTVGHAIERVASYGTYTHGEAVAMGMVAEAQLARRRGLIDAQVYDRQLRLLEKFGLFITPDEILEAGDVLAAMRRDKKVEAGRVRFVLPTGIGQVVIADDVSEDELQKISDL